MASPSGPQKTHCFLSKLTPAINDEPLGPYNSELLELALLTHDYKELGVIADALKKRLLKTVEKTERPRRLRTLDHLSVHDRRRAGVSRSSTVHTMAPFAEYRKDLVVLKCLTVIVHLCQNGSTDFLRWVRANYRQMIAPLDVLVFHPKTAAAIYSKTELIVRYCEHKLELRTARQSCDQMRSEMRPGVFRSESLSRPTGRCLVDSLTTGFSDGSLGASLRGARAN